MSKASILLRVSKTFAGTLLGTMALLLLRLEVPLAFGAAKRPVLLNSVTPFLASTSARSFQWILLWAWTLTNVTSRRMGSRILRISVIIWALALMAKLCLPGWRAAARAPIT